MPRTQSLLRLAAGAQAGSIRVDRSGLGRLLGVSLMTPGPALGHGFELDTLSIKQVAAQADGIRGRWTHPSPLNDGLGTFLGRWTAPRTENGKAVADFHFSEAAHQYHPPGLQISAAQWLMDRAEQDPDVLGVSVVADMDVVMLSDAAGAKRVGRVRRLDAADFVDEPAANPAGLFKRKEAAVAKDRLEDEEEEEIPAGYEEGEEPEAEEAAEEEELEHEPDHEEPAEEEEEAEDMAAALAELLDRVAALEDELTTVKASRDTLRAKVEGYQLAEAKRVREEREAYVVALAEQSASLQAPIPAADLELIRARFAADDTEGAEALGRAFLSRSEAQSKTPATGRTVRLGQDSRATTVDATARLLRARGYQVELSEDGTEITKKLRRQ